MKTRNEIKWVIYMGQDPDDDDLPLFWSNKYGAGDLSTATVFSAEERNRALLPMQGRWMVMPEEVPESSNIDIEYKSEPLEWQKPILEALGRMAPLLNLPVKVVVENEESNWLSADWATGAIILDDWIAIEPYDYEVETSSSVRKHAGYTLSYTVYDPGVTGGPPEAWRPPEADGCELESARTMSPLTIARNALTNVVIHAMDDIAGNMADEQYEREMRERGEEV